MGIMIKIGTLCAVAALTFVGPAMAGSERAPVMMGGNPNFPACYSIGFINGLGPRRAEDPKSGFLSVRSGPGGSAYYEMDRVYNGQEVFVCDTIGPWLAVVYARLGASRDVCGRLLTIMPIRQVYSGPCRSGWVHKNYVEITAG